MTKPIDFEEAKKSIQKRKLESQAFVPNKEEHEGVSYFYDMDYQELVDYDYTKLEAPEWEYFIKAMLNHLFEFVDLVPAISTDLHNVAQEVDEVVNELYDKIDKQQREINELSELLEKKGND